MAPQFLQLADVERIHVDQIERYGGLAGIRDLRLLQSAIAMPRASFAGEWLHRDRYEMAAAYGFHVCRNHPFIDGNKPTALACALVFLELNGISNQNPEGRLHQTIIDVAAGDIDKLGLAQVFRRLAGE